MTDGRAPRSQPRSADADVDVLLARVRPPEAGPRGTIAIAITAAVLLVAVLRPWGVGPETTLQTDVAFVPAGVTPAPTLDRTPAGIAAPICLGAGAWRVASLEHWREGNVRVWRAVEPLEAASGPADPAIPTVPVSADLVTGLGWCAPAFGPDEPVGPARVQAWRVAGRAAEAIALRQVQPVEETTPIAALYVPAADPWTTGRVVFRYEDEATGRVRWFAAQLDVRVAPSSPSRFEPGSLPSAAPAHGPGWSQDGAPAG